MNKYKLYWRKMWLGLFSFFFYTGLLVLHIIHDLSGWGIQTTQLQVEKLNAINS